MLITDGTEGYVIWGPNTQVKQGKYNFTVNYQIIDSPTETSTIGYFDVEVNKKQIGKIELKPNKTSVTIPNVTFDKLLEGEQFSYRVYENNEVILKIKSFKIEKNE